MTKFSQLQPWFHMTTFSLRKFAEWALSALKWPLSFWGVQSTQIFSDFSEFFLISNCEKCENQWLSPSEKHIDLSRCYLVKTDPPKQRHLTPARAIHWHNCRCLQVPSDDSDHIGCHQKIRHYSFISQSLNILYFSFYYHYPLPQFIRRSHLPGNQDPGCPWTKTLRFRFQSLFRER